MEDRYEIRGKIGQGGLGAVYKGYDTRMHREVAIKRIPHAGEDAELLAESTRQLIKEAGALASLQHPHIVTVYDVGSDEDGPYVVMELITGKTLDELIERAPLTWPDFRELAMQTQEALIAAQELNLIHSDLKPSNLMLTWLPSGKFQVKIVDFGLATLAQSQGKQDLDALDAVFGSVFFMPPEQFERVPLDARSDMYSLGCVYYQALTGCYPFDGKTGNEVMEAHLMHTVKPISEVRSEIPLWACDWIMWHINRYPQDRPDSSREALSVFLRNDRVPNAAMSTGMPKPVAGPPRPRLVIPGSGPPPRGNGPATQALAKAKLVKTSQVATLAKEAASISQTAPQPLAPPEGFKPSVHTADDPPATQPLPPDTQKLGPATQKLGPATQKLGTAQAAGAARVQPVSAATQRAGRHVAPAKSAGRTGKSGGKSRTVLMVVGVVVLAVLSGLVVKLVKIQLDKRVLTELLAQAEKTDPPGKVKVSSATLQLLLVSMINNDSDSKLQSAGKALTLAEAADGTDVDTRICDFAIKRGDLPLPVRELLIGQVLQTRNNPVILPAMIDLATTSKESEIVTAALQAARQLADDSELPVFLKLLQNNDVNEVRVAAELNLETIIKKSKKPADLAKLLNTARESTLKPDVQKAIRRLIGVCDTLKH